jgi:hypothetical protein
MIENIARFFEPGFEVWRWEPVPDAWGGTVKQWVQRQDVEGLLRPLKGELRVSADKETEYADHRFYCFPFTLQTVTDEPVVMTGVVPQRLDFKTVIARDLHQLVGSLVVTNNVAPIAPYTVAVDYSVALDEVGYTTITRIVTGTIADGGTVLASYTYTPGIIAGDEIRVNGKRYTVKFVADMMSMGRLLQVDCEEVR